MTWRKPVIEQIEQLQSSAGTGESGSSAVKRMAPQWQPPETFCMDASIIDRRPWIQQLAYRAATVIGLADPWTMRWSRY